MTPFEAALRNEFGLLDRLFGFSLMGHLFGFRRHIATIGAALLPEEHRAHDLLILRGSGGMLDENLQVIPYTHCWSIMAITPLRVVIGVTFEHTDLHYDELKPCHWVESRLCFEDNAEHSSESSARIRAVFFEPSSPKWKTPWAEQTITSKINGRITERVR